MQLGEEQQEPKRANGSGSSHGRVRDASARSARTDDDGILIDGDVPEMFDRPLTIATPLVDRVVESDSPLPPSAPVLLPSGPSDSASLERWDRSRDLVSLGECLVEMSRRPDGAYQPSIAGDAFNTLFYASRLGLRCGLVTAVGDDLFTPMIVERITDEGIDLSNVFRLSNRRNGIYFIEHDAWGERSFHYWRDDSAATETMLHVDAKRLERYVRDANFLLVTGVTLAVFKQCHRLRELLESVHGHTTIVLDANYRPRLWKSALEYQFQIELVLPFVDVYLPSRQDLESAYPEQAPIEVLRAAADAGVATIVMKDGERGCAMFIDDELIAVPPVERPHIVDTTGAGDAFNAGLVGGLLRGSTLEQCCDLAQRVAARSLIVPGAIDPSFTPHAIQASWVG